MENKKSNEEKQDTNYKALLNQTNKEIKALEAEKEELSQKLKYPYTLMLDFMHKSTDKIREIALTIDDNMIVEQKAITALVMPYYEINTITKTMVPFNYKLEVLKALKNKSMGKEELDYTVAKSLLAFSKEALSKASKIIELLEKFDEAKKKLIEVYPLMAKYDSGVN